MSTLLLVKFLHLLGFVYWLGGDLGTFYASRFVTDSELSPEARSTALKIMMGCDQAPRLAMPLMLGTGVHLAGTMGLLPGGGLLLVCTWLVVAAWLAMVLALWIGEHADWAGALTVVDYWFRIVVLAVIVGSSSAMLLGALPGVPGWVSIKLLVFGAMVALGLAIRARLRPFVAAWIELQAGRGDAATEATIRASVRGCTPYVHAIWLGLLVNAALGLHLI